MDNRLNLALFALLLLCFWALLFYTLRSMHRIPLRKQLAALVTVIRQGSFRLSTLVLPERRRGRELHVRYDELTTAVKATDIVGQAVEDLLRDPGTTMGMTGEIRVEIAQRRAAALMDLRVFLGRLEDGDITLLARHVNRADFAGRLNETAINGFLEAERDRADDASELEIFGHRERWMLLLSQLFDASCQPSEKTL